MDKQFQILALIATLGFSGAANTAQAAVVVSNDTVFGPNSVLRDTGTNLDYLSLDKTMGYGYAGIVAEFGAGGDFAGQGMDLA